MIPALLMILAQAAPAVAPAPRWLVIVMEAIFAFLCLILVLLIAISPSQGEGLASAFSGVGSESFFGSRAQSKINWITASLTVTSLVLAVAINLANAGSPTSTVVTFLIGSGVLLGGGGVWLARRQDAP